MSVRISLPAASVTIPANDVTPASAPLSDVSYIDGLMRVLGTRSVVEAYSRDSKSLVQAGGASSAHAFIEAANLAFDQHYPLALSPDMIWLLIAQGVALHINANHEALRHHFVGSQENATIVVERHEFLRGFEGNDWEGVFEEFSEQIKGRVGDLAHGRLVPQFSTTGIVERAAFAVTLMDALQQYFNYEVMTLCGIPEVTLEGTLQDWQTIRAKAAELADYGLDWWIDALLPVLDQFVAAHRGEIDTDFWQNLYKRSDSSGGPYISGHLVNLFPYLLHAKASPESQDSRVTRWIRWDTSPEERREYIRLHQASRTYRNPFLGSTFDAPANKIRFLTGIKTSQLPTGLSVAPFLWRYRGEKLPMEFVAGFVGTAQDRQTLALRPEIGWAVRYSTVNQ